MDTLSKFLFIIGSCLYVYRLDIGPAKPTEYVYSLAVYFGLLYLLHKENAAKLKSLGKNVFACLFVATGSIFFATILTLVRYGFWFDTDNTRLLLKYVLNLLLFPVLFIFFRDDRSFLTRMAAALSLPMLAYALFPFLPMSIVGRFIDTGGSGGRFHGFSVNPGAIAFAMIEAISFIYAKWLYLHSLKSFLRIPYLVFFLAGVLVLLWTGCRIPLIATVVSIVAGSIMYGWGVLKGRISTVVLMSLLRFAAVVVTCVVAFRFLAPESVLETFTTRVFGVRVANLSTDPVVLMQAYQRLRDPRMNPRIDSSRYYGDLFLSNPLGLGLTMMEGFGLVEPNGAKRVPDSFLSTLLHGGFMLAVAMTFLMVIAISVVIRNLRLWPAGCHDLHIVSYVGASAALMAQIVVTAFGGFDIYGMHFWTVMAMCLAGCSVPPSVSVRRQAEWPKYGDGLE